MDLPSTNSQNSSMKGEDVAAANDKKSVRPQPDHAENCPRCDSGNTKFCYYNNYSLTQPRYFCKGCRRYWTKGGTLRNVPVGGGCRKNKRSTKRALDNHHLLLVQSQQLESNNNVIFNSASFDPNGIHSSVTLADHSNYSSPLRYEDTGACDSLSLAFATLQRQRNVQVNLPYHNLGFGFDLKSYVLAHQEPDTVYRNQVTSSTNPGLLSNFFEPHTLTSFNSNHLLYNYGAQSLNDHTFTKPLLLDEDKNLHSMGSAEGFNPNGIRVLWGQKDNDNNDLQLGGGSSFEKNNNNLVNGTNVSNNYNYNYNDVYEEVQGSERSESWNNAGLLAASSWPSLNNTTALII